MEDLSPNEDERGVDVGQIRRLLRMTVVERVAEMVAASNTVLDIQARVRRPSIRPTG
ncbi:MAG: hypothetical protein ABI862_10815 [Ilumatobacteraceae bacterium]